MSSTTNTLIELLTCCRFCLGHFVMRQAGVTQWTVCAPSLSVCVCNVYALWKTKANGNALLIRQRNVAGSKRALLIKKAEWKWLKNEKKTETTCNTWLALALCSEARTCPNDAKAYYQKQSRVSPCHTYLLPSLHLLPKLLWSELGMELKMFWRVTARGNGMQKFSTWVAFHSGSSCRRGNRKRWLERRGYEEGRQGTYSSAGSSVAFCFVALPRNTFSLSLSLSISFCLLSEHNQWNRLFSMKNLSGFLCMSVYIVNTIYNKVFFLVIN